MPNQRLRAPCLEAPQNGKRSNTAPHGRINTSSAASPEPDSVENTRWATISAIARPLTTTGISVRWPVVDSKAAAPRHAPTDDAPVKLIG